MNCTHARQLMMDRLYETIPLQESIALETHLISCANCSLEWNAVQDTHSFMHRLPMEEPSPSVQSAVLAMKFDPVPRVHSGFILRYTAYAAVFMALLFSSLHFFNQHPIDTIQAKPDHNQISSINLDSNLTANILDQVHPTQEIAAAPANPQAEQTNTEAQGTAPSRTGSIVPALQPNSQSSPQFASYEKKTTPKTSEKNAEEAFRSGLKNYNEAFAHVGEEKESLLRGAIVFLQKMEQKYPDQKQWLAMSLILIADAHRELGETPKAISAYRRMIDHFPDLEPYCREARFSMFQLCINPGDDISQAEALLTDYEKHYPKTPEFAELALSYAEKIQDEKPKEALTWANKAAENLPEGHPLEAKTFTLMDELEVKVADQFAIKDWYFLGPLPAGAQPFQGDVEYLPPSRRESFNGANEKISWIHSDSIHPFNINKVLPNLKNNHCAFAVTYIKSPETRLAYLNYPPFSSRVWFNGEPIWGGAFAQEELRMRRSQEPGIKLTLNKGWNELLIKVFVPKTDMPDAKFSLYSEQGNLLTDLTIDPVQGSRNSIEKKAVFRRR